MTALRLAYPIADGLSARTLSFTSDVAAAVGAADVVWITSDTPVDDDDSADVDCPVRQATPAVPNLRDGVTARDDGLEVSAGDRSWALEFATFLEDIRAGRERDPGLEDAQGCPRGGRGRLSPLRIRHRVRAVPSVAR